LSKPDSQADTSDDIVEEPTMEWSLPTHGRIITQFSESDNRKGIDIAGKLGQPVMASANGKVVYSGSGLRGYGKLIIIKHNNTFLSAYAHNNKILVKEGQSVSRGQKIAEMGKTDAKQVELHFEVRRYGKPVDPAKYVPFGKS
jgi:lipoprotein NlpD